MSLPKDWNQGGGALPPRGAQRPSLRDILNPLTELTVAELKAIPPDERFTGCRARLLDGRVFRFNADATVTTDGDQLLVVPTDGDGVWVIEQGSFVDLALAISKDTADAAVLYTIPTACRLAFIRAYWEVTVGFTGGTNSAIGLSSSSSGHTTKGDLLGGAGGDLTATLGTAGRVIFGTIGADVVAGGFALLPTETIKFDRIASVYTAGTGFAHIMAQVLVPPA